MLYFLKLHMNVHLCAKFEVSSNLYQVLNTGASLTTCGEDASLALVCHPSSDDVTIKTNLDLLLDQLRLA